MPTESAYFEGSYEFWNNAKQSVKDADWVNWNEIWYISMFISHITILILAFYSSVSLMLSWDRWGSLAVVKAALLIEEKLNYNTWDWYRWNLPIHVRSFTLRSSLKLACKYAVSPRGHFVIIRLHFTHANLFMGIRSVWEYVVVKKPYILMFSPSRTSIISLFMGNNKIKETTLTA